MKRHFYILAVAMIAFFSCSEPKLPDAKEDRLLWEETMVKIVTPVLENTAAGTLKDNMPYESPDTAGKRKPYAYLEALGRTLCGIAPWLESEDELCGKKAELRELARKAIANAVDPESPDYMTFDKGAQPLVDAAYLAQAMVRAPKQLWEELDVEVQNNLIAALMKTRTIKPGENNWLLFASMVEAAILKYTGECDVERMLYGVNRFKNDFYKGDGMYGDGAAFHMDYYNSYVIQPMLMNVLGVMSDSCMPEAEFLKVQTRRHRRYAEILERMIAPDGTYPVLGRSISACRFGAFQVLSQAALLNNLPETLSPAQVRCALTAVIRRQMENPANFDENGWLKVGFAGSQPDMAENYVNTGSLYHCTTVFVALGLPLDDPFWTDPYAEWTGVKAWSGQPILGDHAIRN